MPRAVRLLTGLTASHDVREAWLALAAARRRGGDPAGAAEALGRALSGHVFDPGTRAMADAVAREAGAAGWCAWSSAGAPVLSARDVTLAPRQGWDAAPVLTATAGGAPLIGSPLRLDAMRRVEGFVATEAGGLRGWAWHPADPARDPEITVEDASGRRLRVVATDQAMQAPPGRLLARPRVLRVVETALARMKPPLRVLGSDGRDLLGSPLDPAAERRAAPAADGSGPPARRAPGVVIPVYGGGRTTLDCLDSVLAARGRGERVVVVDDGSPDPALSAHLRALARARRIELIVHDRARGFPASANAGIRACPDRDVVLLNSDTLVPPGWLDRLREAAHSAPDIGSVSPLSNDATILSYPASGAPCPDAAGVARMAALAARANGAATVDVPTTVGFCMYLRRDCLERTGLLREDVFAQGYGEENDWCLRAAALGWRHAAAAGAYVGHVGGASFGAARARLTERNMAVLNRLHPGYDALIAAYAAADPLAPARRRMDALRWRAARRGRASVVLVTHDEAGGVERQVAADCRALAADGLRPVVLRPARLADGAPGVEVGEGAGGGYPDLRFALPGELDALVRLLRAGRPVRVVVHHMLGHDWSLASLPARLGAPLEVQVHDHAFLCPRVTLLTPGGRFCGVPDADVCDACVAEGGGAAAADAPVAAYRARAAALLAGAERVVAPSRDAASRIARHVPAARVAAVPHEDDTSLPAPAPRPPAAGRARVVAVGAIGAEKGLEVLVAAAQDAAARGLPLDFTLVGYSTDDMRLLDAGVFVTGPFRDGEAPALIAAQRPDIALLPSIWPETWCFALSDCWRAGLDVVAFDIGAPAERMRARGRGVLVPLGASASALNDALLGAVTNASSSRL